VALEVSRVDRWPMCGKMSSESKCIIHGGISFDCKEMQCFMQVIRLVKSIIKLYCVQGG
jgi:hypothetical protein